MVFFGPYEAVNLEEPIFVKCEIHKHGGNQQVTTTKDHVSGVGSRHIIPVSISVLSFILLAKLSTYAYSNSNDGKHQPMYYYLNDSIWYC